jgi:hypothetical protein
VKEENDLTSQPNSERVRRELTTSNVEK